MSQEEAVKIIQVAERARQGRLRAKLNEESKKMNRIYRLKDPGTAGIESAAICIQKVLHTVLLRVCIFLIYVVFLMLNDSVECDLQLWRGYIQRKKTMIARIEEMIFLGMVSEKNHQF